MILSVTVLALLVSAASVGGQELGELQHLMGSVLGRQLTALRSSCCIIRNLPCPPRGRHYVTSPIPLAGSLEQFFRCVCRGEARNCTLLYPELFLPDGADRIVYDVTFVTGPTTSQFICNYVGTRNMTCRIRQSMRTELVEWLLPRILAGTSIASVQANLGIFGEELEEAVEQMMETGLPPAPLPTRHCQSCAPLQCAMTVSSEAEKEAATPAPSWPFYVYRQSPAVARTPPRALSSADQQRFHMCLRRNSIRPPGIKALTDSSSSSAQPERVAPGPKTPTFNGQHDVTASSPRHSTPALPLPSTTAASTSTTVKLGSRKPTVLTSTSKTTRSTGTHQSPDNNDRTTPKAAWQTSTSPTHDVTKTSTSHTSPVTTETPAVITRILVGEIDAPTTSLPTKTAVVIGMSGHGDGSNNMDTGVTSRNGGGITLGTGLTSGGGGGNTLGAGMTSGGGSGSTLGTGGLAGVVAGTAAALAVVTGILAVAVRRRLKKQREHPKASKGSIQKVTSASAARTPPRHRAPQPLSAAHLHTVSSTQAVIDFDEASLDDDDHYDVAKKIDDNDHDTKSIGSSISDFAERYIPPALMRLALKPTSSRTVSASSVGGNVSDIAERNIPAVLLRLAMEPTSSFVVSSSTIGSRISDLEERYRPSASLKFALKQTSSMASTSSSKGSRVSDISEQNISASLTKLASKPASSMAVTSSFARPLKNKPGSSPGSSWTSGDESLYASLDETAIMPRQSYIDDVKPSPRETQVSSKIGQSRSNGLYSEPRRLRGNGGQGATGRSLLPPRYSDVMRSFVATTPSDGDTLYVNTSAGVYDTPVLTQNQSHVYSSVEHNRGTGVSVRGTQPKTSDPYYLHPCLTPAASPSESAHITDLSAKPPGDTVRSASEKLSTPLYVSPAPSASLARASAEKRDPGSHESRRQRNADLRPTLPSRADGSGQSRKTNRKAATTEPKTDEAGYLEPLPLRRP